MCEACFVKDPKQKSLPMSSCTAPEMTIKTCERCGKKETTTKGKPIGHKWGKWQLVSVNASGVRNYRTCVRCGLKQYKNSRYKF